MDVGVRDGVAVGTPMSAVALSGFGDEVKAGICVGETNVVVTATGIGVARPAFSIAHLPKPVSEDTTARRMTKISPVKVNPLKDVG